MWQKMLSTRLLSVKYSDYADFKLCLSKGTLLVLPNLGFRYYIPGNLKKKTKQNIDSQVWQSEYFVQVLRKQGWRRFR